LQPICEAFVGSLALSTVLPCVQEPPKKVSKTFRFDVADVENWQLLANKAQLTLSEWIRRKCNGQASNLTSAAEKKGMTAEWLADQIFQVINGEDTLPRDKITAIKTLVAARGEETGAAVNTTLNLKTPKALIIMGTDPASVSRMIGKGS
jgi:hypothetical protein